MLPKSFFHWGNNTCRVRVGISHSGAFADQLRLIDSLNSYPARKCYFLIWNTTYFLFASLLAKLIWHWLGVGSLKFFWKFSGILWKEFHIFFHHPKLRRWLVFYFLCRDEFLIFLQLTVLKFFPCCWLLVKISIKFPVHWYFILNLTLQGTLHQPKLSFERRRCTPDLDRKNNGTNHASKKGKICEEKFKVTVIRLRKIH